MQAGFTSNDIVFRRVYCSVGAAGPGVSCKVAVVMGS